MLADQVVDQHLFITVLRSIASKEPFFNLAGLFFSSGQLVFLGTHDQATAQKYKRNKAF
jgi:hypothetical protein